MAVLLVLENMQNSGRDHVRSPLNEPATRCLGSIHRTAARRPQSCEHERLKTGGCPPTAGVMRAKDELCIGPTCVSDHQSTSMFAAAGAPNNGKSSGCQTAREVDPLSASNFDPSIA